MVRNYALRCHLRGEEHKDHKFTTFQIGCASMEIASNQKNDESINLRTNHMYRRAWKRSTDSPNLNGTIAVKAIRTTVKLYQAARNSLLG